MLHVLRLSVSRGAFVALGLGAATAGWAGSPCDLVTRAEASRLLGVTAGRMTPQDSAAAMPGCLIKASHDPRATLTLSVRTISREDAVRLLQHGDELRGSEVPSMNGSPWFEISVADPQHPDNRVMVVHRDRTSLSLDLHSARQPNAKQAFEKEWFKISQRLPFDERR